MADAFAKSEFVGFDEHARLIEEARRQAAADVAGGRVSFEVAKAKEYPGEGTTWWPTKLATAALSSRHHRPWWFPKSPLVAVARGPRISIAIGLSIRALPSRGLWLRGTDQALISTAPRRALWAAASPSLRAAAPVRPSPSPVAALRAAVETWLVVSRAGVASGARWERLVMFIVYILVEGLL